MANEARGGREGLVFVCCALFSGITALTIPGTEPLCSLFITFVVVSEWAGGRGYSGYPIQERRG